eukprot:2322848-Pleurochrysis_carterae.AAC.2
MRVRLADFETSRHYLVLTNASVLSLPVLTSGTKWEYVKLSGGVRRCAPHAPGAEHQSWNHSLICRRPACCKGQIYAP